MRWRADITPLLLNLLWAGLILAMAAFGAVIVRNMTDALTGIAYQRPSIVVADQPSR